MNANIVEGKWKELRGKIKKQWGKLTDDELDQINGQQDKMIGILQQKYGYTQEKAQDEYNRFMKERTV